MPRASSRRECGSGGHVHGQKEGASFQVIILGSSGGPREDTITGLLVRSATTDWRKGSVIAVDAGAHLAKIIRILEDEHGLPFHSESIPSKSHSRTLKNGPFAGVRCPGSSAKANALYMFRELLHSFLITHPHLDHISGMGINTPALEYGREAKAIVALPSTIDAIKNHIFNDVIWPNLSDEGNGVGFVTYRRLIEGGNPRLGLGEGRGYVNVCEGLATKCWGVSHGRCRRRSHSIGHQGEGSFSFGFAPEGYSFSSRRISQASDGYASAVAAPHHTPQAHVTQSGLPKTPGPHVEGNDPTGHFQPVDSSAFFIRNDLNGEEIIVFGDIEPDSVSLCPRNHIVWEDAAPKIAAGMLKAIFIECSYDDSVRDADLYGHLCPRHLIAELIVLASKVMARGGNHESINLEEPPSPGTIKRKRKRTNDVSDAPPSPKQSIPNGSSHCHAPTSPRLIDTDAPSHTPARHAANPRRGRTVHISEGGPRDPARTPADDHFRPLTPGGSLARPGTPCRPANPNSTPAASLSLPSHLPSPLKGLTVHIIHVKDTLADGPPPGDVILKQLEEKAEEVGLGCDFNVTSDGQSIWI